MYARTEHWISDDEFFEDEFNFLINLMDKYFIGSVLAGNEENNDKVKDIANRFLKLNETREHIATLNKENLSYLVGLLQNRELFDPEECRDRQSDLVSDHVDFLKKSRSLKKEIFQVSEELLQSARSRKLIS